MKRDKWYEERERRVRELEWENKKLKQQLHDILIPNAPPEQEPTETDYIRLFRVLRKAGYPNETS